MAEALKALVAFVAASIPWIRELTQQDHTADKSVSSSSSGSFPHHCLMVPGRWQTPQNPLLQAEWHMTEMDAGITRNCKTRSRREMVLWEDGRKRNALCICLLDENSRSDCWVGFLFRGGFCWHRYELQLDILSRVTKFSFFHCSCSFNSR